MRVAVWLLLLCWLCLPPLSPALLPWAPGYGLALNRRSPTEYAYTYPRRLYRTFTVEMWQRGSSTFHLAPFSVAHPENDNAVLISDQVYVLGVQVTDSGPNCPPTRWCHIALSVDMSAYPAYDVRLYVNAQVTQHGTGNFTSGLRITAMEEDRLAIVYGQDQDSVLGGWDPTQVMSGHVDELRIWSCVRSATEILQNYNGALMEPYPGSLVLYYRFDDVQWDDTYFEDRVNASVQRRLYVADYTNATTAPTIPPAYAPPVAPLQPVAVSSAPLCAGLASRSFAAVRVGPSGSVAIPVSSLYCNAAAAVTVMVTAVSGGTVSGLGVALGSSQTITFVAASGGIVPGAGFNFTATDGTATVAGFVGVLPNAAPALATQLDLTGDEDVETISWVTTVDPDRDIVALQVVAYPSAGLLQLDPVNRSVQFTPPAYANGNGVGRFTMRAWDQWGLPSNNMLAVSINLRPVPNAPVLVVNTNFSIYRGQRITIPFQVVDVDGLNPFVIVSDWPTPTQGLLEGQEGSRTWTINEASMSSKLQWASGYGNYSTMYASKPYDAYGIGQLVGLPTSTKLGDWTASWCPLTINGGCNNRADSSESAFIFYTEFFEAKFATPMYLSDVVLVQNDGGDRVTRILVPSDRDASKWKTILTRDLTTLAPAPSATKYSVESPAVCQVVWPVDRVRVELDTCHRNGWYEVDAVQIRGGVVAPKNVLNTTTQLAFRAAAGYTGTVVFGLTATQCMGSFDDTSPPLSITVVVKDTPYVLATGVQDGWSSIDVGTLDSGVRVGNVMVLEMPTYGTLRYGDRVLANADTLEDLGSTSTVFQFQAYRCDASLADTFLVQLGPTAVVQVNVQGCTTAMSLIVPVVVPCVVGPLAIGLLGFLWWRHTRGQRDNSRAPKDPEVDVCVLFTDIQASTLLWGEVPETMSTALDAHHALIRRLIRRHKCYEVKTIGDSFMIVTADPVAALQLALAIQDALFEHDWEGKGLDEVYRRQTDCHLAGDAYARLWHGIRVRVGMHYGQAQITFDETTKGYDYYGTVVNTAARIEGAAHGGQVLLSHEAYSQVASFFPASEISVTPLGITQLRGLKAPVDLIQILPVRFAAREFPPLRLDHGRDLEPEEDVEDAASDAKDHTTVEPAHYPQALDREVLTHPMVRSGAMSNEAAASLAYNVFYTLKSHLNMYKKPEERLDRLREMCRRWHVPCKAASAKQENASLGRLALQFMGSVANQLHSSSLLEGRKTSVAESGVRSAEYTPRQPSNRVLPSPSFNTSPVPSPQSEARLLTLVVDK